MHLLSRVVTFQGRRAASALYLVCCRGNLDWLCCVHWWLYLLPALWLISCLSLTFHHLSPCLTFVFVFSHLHSPPQYLTPTASFSFSAFQWPCTPSVQCISLVWWCVWCWRWLRWCACCQPSLSPACSSITWETTRRGKNLLQKTAVTRMTGGILGISMTRSRQGGITEITLH